MEKKEMYNVIERRGKNDRKVWLRKQKNNEKRKMF